jgi:hypothetical protein
MNSRIQFRINFLIQFYIFVSVCDRKIVGCVEVHYFDVVLNCASIMFLQRQDIVVYSILGVD